MKTSLRRGGREAGASIIEILFSVALLGLGSMIFIQYSKTTMANRSAAELLRQRTLIATMLINGTVCSKTANCVGSGKVALKDINERVLVAADGNTKFGPYQVQAVCQPDKTIQVRAAVPMPGGKFKNDPLTGKPMSFSEKSSVILDSGALCGTLDKPATAAKISLVRSPRCAIAQGTCPPPPEAAGLDLSFTKMCCQDGRDVAKPSCGKGKELGAYWDREGNWGAEGSWVVFCE